MASGEKNLPASFGPGEIDAETEAVKMATTKNLKWAAKVGSQTYGTPTIGSGKVLIGTNNESPRDPRRKGDRGIVMCFDEKSGKFLWQFVSTKLGSGKVNDWEYLGICSSPTIDGDRVYIVTNRCEIACLDLNGLANGNDGPFKDEKAYMTPKGEEPVEPGPGDADIIWVYDMIDQVGAFPHNVASSSILVVGDKLFATTSNGVDWSHKNIPKPKAPSFICLDKKTGELLGEEGSGISKRVLHCNWSSPAYAELGGRPTVFFGAGDGWCYAFGPEAKKDDEGFGILPEFWKQDCNAPEYRRKPDGRRPRYATEDGPSECISTAVFHDGLVYAVIGQDPEHGEGVGMLSCFDAATGEPKWRFKEIKRSLSTPSVAGGLLTIADYSGNVFCLDAKTGKEYWRHETNAHIWGSTLAADGKVYLGTEDGELIVFQAGKEKKILHTVELDAPIYASVVAANGVLYVSSMTHLYAVENTGKK